MIYSYLPIVAGNAISATRRQNVSIGDDSHERRQLFPRRGPEKVSRRQLLKKPLNLQLTMVDNLDPASCDETPQVHETVDRGIHGEKIRIYHWHRDFPDVCAGPSSEKSRL